MGFDCRLEEEELPPPPRAAQEVNGVHSGSPALQRAVGAPAERLLMTVDRGPVSAQMCPGLQLPQLSPQSATTARSFSAAAKHVSFDSEQPGKGRWRKSGFTELQEPLRGILLHEYADVLSRKL